MNDKTRKILPLAGAIALTSSALLAGTGSALAGKAAPSIEPQEAFTGKCTTGNPYTYFATVDLSQNKGRWIYIEASLAGGGGAVMPPTKVQTGPHTVRLKGNGGQATMTVTVTTRKGVPTTASLTTAPIYC